MARSEYAVGTSATVALSAGVARTALVVLGSANVPVDLLKFSMGFDGISTNAVPVFWELCALTGATNSTPGTNNTSETANIQQLSGRTAANGFTAFSAAAATFEPTVMTRLRSNYLTPTGSLWMYDFPLGDSPDSPLAQGFALRFTAPAAVNVRADFQFARA